MPSRLIGLIQNEMHKMFRFKLTYFFQTLAVGIILLWGLSAGFLFQDASRPGAGYYFLLTSTQTAISFLGTIFILIFGALLVSSETSGGTLQMILVNPVSRLEFLVAKLTTGWFFSILLALSMVLPALVIGGIKFGYGNYAEEGLTLFTQSQIFTAILLCFLLLSIVLLAFVSYSLLISVLMPNIGYSIGLSVGSILFLDLLKDRLKISPFLFQSYVETPFELVKSLTEGFAIAWKPDIYLCIGVPFAWSVVCFVAAFLVFSRKDYKS